MVFLLLALIAAPAEARYPTLEEMVARDISGLISDTVNEGEQTATVIEKNGKPDVSCKNSPRKDKPGASWNFCRVNFLVKYEDLSTERECGLLYTVDPDKGLVPERANDQHFRDCVEWLGESIE